MRNLFTLTAAGLLTLFLTLTPALAANKFKNEDTAKNRRDNVMGTRVNEQSGTTTIEKNEYGDSVIDHEPSKTEEVDWYDKLKDLNPQLEIKKTVE